MNLAKIPEAITEIFPAYRDFLQSARFKVAYGGRGSAKTRQFVSILLNNVLFFGWRLVCFREVMKSLEDSVYQEFVDEIERTGREKYFKIIHNEIRCLHLGGKIKFEGLLRNKQKVKGYAGYHAAWVEEGENVSKESWKFLIPTFRNDESEIWVSYNPEDILSETHQMFVMNCRYPEYKNGKRYCIVKKINYTDNPRFPQTLRDDMELMKAADFELYNHVYLGEPVGNSNLAIIKPFWIQAAIDAHIKLWRQAEGGKLAGFDVADEGPDSNALICRHGIVVTHCEEWKDIDPNSAARYVYNEALRMGLDTIKYDNIGVGAGAKGAIREEENKTFESSRKIKIPRFEGFTANAVVAFPDQEYVPNKTNKDMFVNLKAQSWWLLADRFRNTYDAINGKPFDPELLISLPSDLPNLSKLCAELSQPRREFLNGRFQVEPKKLMKKRGVNSPNLADALVMCFAPESSFDLAALL